MNFKKRLNAIIALCLSVVMTSTSVFAAPMMAGTMDSAAESVVEDVVEEKAEVAAEGSVAKIGETQYETFAAAMNAANAMTGDVVVEIYGVVEYSASTPNLDGAYDSITFTGKTDDAEIALTRNGQGGYISASKKVVFNDLILSKEGGYHATNAAHMNFYFSIQGGFQEYNNCVFPNGACASTATATYTECEFQNPDTTSKYSLWVYDDAVVTVDTCKFTGLRGIKMYEEGPQEINNAVTVKNTDFSATTGDKPAIVLTYGGSVTLEENNYSTTGVLELDKDGKPNGTTVTADITDIACNNDDYTDCGVLVDGKIYVTLTDAVNAGAVKEDGSSTVTVLYDASAEDVTLPIGTTVVENTNSGSVAVATPVAKIGEVGYATLAKAIEAAVDGDTVVLTADVADVEATIENDIVLDLGTKTVTDAYIIVTGDVTIKNGSIKNTNEPYPLVVQNSGKLTIDNVAIEASKSDRAIWVRSGSKLVFNSGSILATKGENNTKTNLIAAIYTDSNTDVTINGGTITVDTPDNKAVGIFGNYTNANVTVNGGKISTSGKGYNYGINVDGDITVTGGEIVTNEKGYGYSSGIRYGFNYALVSATGDVTVTGGNITTNGYSGYIVNVGRSYNSNEQTVSITGGTFANNLSEVEQTTGGHKAPALVWEGNAASVTATITDGDFSGFSANLLRKDSSEEATLTVSGGVFDVNVNEDYLAEGFELKDNGDGTYGVSEAPKGTLTYIYTRSNGFWGEGTSNSKASFVVELYEGDNKIATSSLNDESLVDGDVYVTWSIPFTVTSGGKWDVEWAEGYPKYDMNPTKGVLVVDGVKVAENVIKYSGADDVNKIVAIAEGFTGGVVAYTTLEEAIGDFNGRKVNVLRDVTESIDSFNGCTLTTNVEGGVTINNTYADYYVYCNDFAIGNGVTVNCQDVFMDTEGVNTVEGKLNVAGTFYHAYDAKTTVQNGGSIAVNGTTILRYNKTQDAGIYIYGDGDDSTVEYDCGYYIGAYSGTFYAEDANIETGYFLLKNSYDNDNYANIDMTLDNSSLTVVGTTDTQDSFIIDDKASLTLVNGSSIEDVRDFNILAGAKLELTVDETSSISATYVNIADDVNLSAEKNADGTVTFKRILLGEGTEANPILINDLEDLKAFRDAVNTYTQDGSNQFKGKYVKLTADIDLEGENWEPIGTANSDHGSFKGIFDGGDHTISNLYVNGNGGHLGFFARVGSYEEGLTPTVKNITFKNVDISANVTNHWTANHGDYVGIIANAGGNSVVEGIKVTGDVYVVGCGYVGGIVGHGYPDLTNCHVDANDGSYVNAGYWCAGGIIGYAGEGGTPIKNCSVKGLDIWSAYGAAAAVAGLLEDGNVLENVYAEDVEVTSASDYCMGYIAGNGEGSTLTNVTMTNVTATANGKPITSTDAVAEVGGATFFTLMEASTAATEGDTITVLRDVTEDVTVPAGVIFNGNGKQVGDITAEGEITFKGYTKATSFSVMYVGTTINIGEGACLEITGTGRMVIGHGCTFNITGSIADAKTANTAELTPSLIVKKGASFTGNSLNFNVTNAYIKFNDNSTSKNSNANGTFNFKLTNSILEQTGTFAFYVPTEDMDPTFNLTLKDSVLNSTSHLVFAVTKGEIVIDNSNVNVGANRQIENRSTMTIKNGSVVNGAVATSSNAKNPGTLIVENATYSVTGEFTGSDLGTGTIVIKDGASFTAGSVTKANIQVDATNMSLGDVVNLTANLEKFEGTVEVLNNENLKAAIVDNKIVLVERYFAQIGDAKYETLQAAIDNAAAGDTIKLIFDVTENVTFKAPAAQASLMAESADGVTLDLDGKTLTGTVTVESGAKVAIENGTITSTGVAVENHGTMVMTDVTVNGKVTSNSEWLKMEDCTVIGAISGKVKIYSGVYSTDPSAFLADKAIAVQGADGMWTVHAARTLYLVPVYDDDKTVKTNEKFTVEAYVDGVSPKGVRWNLSYNTTYFELVSMTANQGYNHGTELEPEIIIAKGTMDITKPVATYVFKSKTLAVDDSPYVLSNVDIRTVENAWEETDVSGTITNKDTRISVINRTITPVVYDGGVEVTVNTIEVQHDSAKVFDIYVKAFEDSAELTDATITYTYKYAGTSKTLTELPDFSDVGTYQIGYKIEKEGYTTVEKELALTVNIKYNQYTVDVKFGGEVLTTDNKTISYTGDEYEFVVTSNPAAKITYKVNDGAATETAPVIKGVGTYTIEYTVEGSPSIGYEQVTKTVVITVNKPNYIVEVSFGEDTDYVFGTKLVLVHTDAKGVTFNFDGVKMYDVSDAGYCLYQTTTKFDYVYALVVDASIYGGMQSDYNDYYNAVTLDYVNGADKINYVPNEDVNLNVTVTWNDIMSAYSVAERDEYAFKNQMAGFIKADTNRNKHATSADATSIIGVVYGKN